MPSRADNLIPQEASSHHMMMSWAWSVTGSGIML